MIQLEKVIIDIIKSESSIPFVKFMELALYYPTLGYYTSSRPKIGKDGDFYTSPDVNPLFGRMVAKRIQQEISKAVLGSNDDFHIIEFGAGKGLLALDILKYFQEEAPELLKVIKYHIIDVSPSLIKLQQENLSKLMLVENQVTWLNDLSSFTKPVLGCFISNELIDAFPVHLVQQTEEGLKEVYVTYDQKEKEWLEILKNPSTPLLEQYLNSQEINLALDQKAEINLAALSWLESVASKLDRGLVITIDYGFPAQELYADFRYNGTLVCYKKHQLVENPYQDIGEQDITAHVNFTALIQKGNELGLNDLSFNTQSKFLLDLGIMDAVAQMATDPHSIWQATIAAKKLIMPGGMGDTFKVLIQEKYPAS